MNDVAPNREFARGEVQSMIHWGKDVQEALDLLQTKYGITGEEADAMIVEAFAVRKAHVRKKAMLGLAFAIVGLAIPVAYFGIQRSVGFIVIGYGQILMGMLGLASVAMALRSVVRIFTGEGPV